MVFFILSNTGSYESSEIQSLFPNNLFPFYLFIFSLWVCMIYVLSMCTGVCGGSAWWHDVCEYVLCMWVVCVHPGKRECWVYKFITFYLINLRQGDQQIPVILFMSPSTDVCNQIYLETWIPRIWTVVFMLSQSRLTTEPFP